MLLWPQISSKLQLERDYIRPETEVAAAERLEKNASTTSKTPADGPSAYSAHARAADVSCLLLGAVVRSLVTEMLEAVLKRQSLTPLDCRQLQTDFGESNVFMSWRLARDFALRGQSPVVRA